MSDMPEMNYIVRDLQRRLANMIKRGRVHSVDFEQQPPRVRVEYAKGAVTGWLPWVSGRASNKYRIDWEPLAIGEQVIILSESGELSAGVVIPSLSDATSPVPCTSPDEHVSRYEDGTTFTYNCETHTLTVDIQGDANLHTTGNVTAHIEGNADVHTEGNVTAQIDGDSNIHTVGNVTAHIEGNSDLHTVGNVTAQIDGDSNIHTVGNVTAHIEGNSDLHTEGNVIAQIDGTADVTVAKATTVKADATLNVKAAKDLNITTSTNMVLDATGNIDIKAGGNVKVTGTRIDWN